MRELPEFSKRWAEEDRFGTLQNELKYADMPCARKWANEFREGIKDYGFRDNQILRYKDFDFETMDTAMSLADKKIKQNSRDGRRTLFVCFYAGHGAYDGINTIALLNSKERELEEGNQYPLEKVLRKCANLAGAYFIGLFACDRMNLPEAELRGGTED